MIESSGKAERWLFALKPTEAGNYSANTMDTSGTDKPKRRRRKFSWTRVVEDLRAYDRKMGVKRGWKAQSEYSFKKKAGLIPRKQVPDFTPLPQRFLDPKRASTNTPITTSMSRSRMLSGKSNSGRKMS